MLVTCSVSSSRANWSLLRACAARPAKNPPFSCQATRPRHGAPRARTGCACSAPGACAGFKLAAKPARPGGARARAGGRHCRRARRALELLRARRAPPPRAFAARGVQGAQPHLGGVHRVVAVGVRPAGQRRRGAGQQRVHFEPPRRQKQLRQVGGQHSAGHCGKSVHRRRTGSGGGSTCEVVQLPWRAGSSGERASPAPFLRHLNICRQESSHPTSAR